MEERDRERLSIRGRNVSTDVPVMRSQLYALRLTVDKIHELVELFSEHMNLPISIMYSETKDEAKKVRSSLSCTVKS